MFKKIQMMAIALTMCSVASAQQSNVNLSYNPQKDTEGLVPFSASLNSPQVNDDHTVIFRIKAPQANEVKLSGAMLTVMHQRTMTLRSSKKWHKNLLIRLIGNRSSIRC